MQDLKTFRNILAQVVRILNKRQRIKALGMCLIITVGAIFELLGVSIMLPFVQAIVSPKELLNKQYVRFIMSFLGITGESSIVIMLGIGIVLIYVIKNAFLALSAYLQAAYCNRTQMELSVLMMKAYMKRPYLFFVEHGTAEIMRGVNGDVYGVCQVIQNGFKLISELVLVALIAIFLTQTDVVMALGVLVCGLTCLLLVVVGLKKKISHMSTLYRDSSMELYKWISQISGGIKDIFVFRRQKFFLNSFEQACDGARISGTYNTFVGMLPERIIETICVSGIMATVLIRLRMEVEPQSFVPQMAVFAMGAFRLLPSISRSTGYINAFVYNREWVESAYKNIKAANMLNLNENYDNTSKDLMEGKKSFDEKIEVVDIQWKYPETKSNVLEDTTLTVCKGESIGIVGESGSGKSTLADMLLRLYTPIKGEIRLDGVDIETIPRTWSGIMGYVPQTVFLIDDTIRENVVFGADNKDDEKVWSVLRKASLDKFVEGLPDGLDTIVGERGVKFSGGQRQRIAIARALYADPQILILDEATAALDNETEEAVMEAIDALAGTMTLIIIAHRVTTLRNCDKIYEISNGKAIERDKNEVLGIGAFL